MAERIHLVIVEDNRLLREGLTVMLKEQIGIFSGCLAQRRRGLHAKKRLKPDVILPDFVLRNRNTLLN